MKASRVWAVGMVLPMALCPSCARDRSSASPAAELAPAAPAASATAGSPAAPEATPLVPPPAPVVPQVELPKSLRVDVGVMDAATAYGALDAASRALEDSLRASAPDCPTAHVLGDRVCALAARLCQLAEDKAANAEVRAHCEDGKPRCEHARARVAAACE